MNYGKIVLTLSCRKCVMGGKGTGDIIAGVTKDLEIQVVCKKHGNVSLFKMDGSDLGEVASILHGGCENCRGNKEHVHD